MTQLPLYDLQTCQYTYPLRQTEPRTGAIRLKSFTGSGWQTISLDEQTCDCDEFRSTGRRCKHLMALGIHRLRPFIAKTHPTFSQALSGLVKSIRLRRVADALYWLVYFDNFRQPQYRFRTARRLLISSAEDGHSVAVMERVAESFPYSCRPQAELTALAEEVIRICKVPNWWHPSTGGPDYIYSGMVGERQLTYFTGDLTLENMAAMIEQGIGERNKPMALAGLMGLSAARVGATKQAELVLGLAKKHQHSLAERLAEVHLHARSALSSDNNFLCQAVWMMAGGESPVADLILPVVACEVTEGLDAARERWKTPSPIPGWCCDGVHSAGNDVRFMGIWPHMFAVCKAYEHYGRVDPGDVWLPEFHSYDGLLVEKL